MSVFRRRPNNNQMRLVTGSDVEEVPSEPIISEEDQSLIILLFLSLIMTIFLPCILAISPNLLTDGPVLLSFVVLLITGPAFFITIKEARFLLSGVLAIASSIYEAFSCALSTC